MNGAYSKSKSKQGQAKVRSGKNALLLFLCAFDCSLGLMKVMNEWLRLKNVCVAAAIMYMVVTPR